MVSGLILGGVLRMLPTRSIKGYGLPWHSECWPSPPQGSGARPGAPPKVGTAIWMSSRTILTLKIVAAPFWYLRQARSPFIRTVSWRRSYCEQRLRPESVPSIVPVRKIEIKHLAQRKLASHTDLCIYPLEKCH
jgi:hypothetical protein